MWATLVSRLGVGFVICGSALAQGDSAPNDEALVAAFQKLEPGLQQEAVEWFCAECERLPTYQRELIDFVLKSLEQDPLAWPDAPEPKVYDAAEHCPAQPIERRFVDSSKPTHKAVLERMLRKVPARELAPAFTYDWSLGTVVRVAPLRDPQRVARNAARGIEPRVDLVEAIVTLKLDSGAVRDVATAFAHAYSDRTGNAYRELTLYDAWASGAEMEMPDVECLGIVHDLKDDWKTWVAPVAERKQESLYEWIGERFVPYHRERNLRTALARSYLLAAPVQRDGYGPAQGRLHAFWERSASDPAALAKDLPNGARWAKWLEVEGEKVDTNLELWQRAEARRDALRESQDYVRRTWVGILRELGAL
ncbi:MAG: hypothetical protein R3F49_20555 [Planctomycetota bacterium]